MGCRTEQRDNYDTANNVEGCHFIYLLRNFSRLKHLSCFSKSLVCTRSNGEEMARRQKKNIYIYIMHTHTLQNIYMGRTRSAIISNQDVIDLVLDFSLPLSFSQQHLALVTAGHPGSVVTHHYVSVSHTIRNLCVFVPWSLAPRRKTRSSPLLPPPAPAPTPSPQVALPLFQGTHVLHVCVVSAGVTGRGWVLVLCCQSINSVNHAPLYSDNKKVFTPLLYFLTYLHLFFFPYLGNEALTVRLLLSSEAQPV